MPIRNPRKRMLPTTNLPNIDYKTEQQQQIKPISFFEE